MNEIIIFKHNGMLQFQLFYWTMPIIQVVPKTTFSETYFLHRVKRMMRKKAYTVGP
jgi:hypothetical protein